MGRLSRILPVLLISTAIITLFMLTAQAQSPTPPQAQGIILPDTSAVITELGGKLASPDGQIIVMFPSTTTRKPTTVTLSFNTSQTIPARFVRLSPIFVVKALPLSQLSMPMTITIRYTPLAGIHESEVTLVYYDTVAQKWSPLPTMINNIHHVATAMINQPGQFVLIWRQAITTLPSDAVIVDDLDATKFITYSLMTASWRHAYTSTAGYYNHYMYWTYRQQNERDNYATWTPGLRSGTYEVFAFIASYNTNTTNARYQIVHQGITTEHSITQSIYFAEWVSLGMYEFGSDAANNYVLLDDVTHEITLTRIGFDAIGFVPPKVYLPVVLRNYPLTKVKSGMHMGNINNMDWSDDMLAPFDPEPGGAWPPVVVALTNQVFTITRGADCRITGVQVKHWNLYNYLRRAEQHDSWVIFRVYPSPGNFAESVLPGWPDPLLVPTRTLVLDSNDPYKIPEGRTQCEGYDNNLFRSVADVGDEMLFIQQFILWEPPVGYQWQAFGFEPANEPNAEYYNFGTRPSLDQKQSWQDMDQYFASIYDYVHANDGGGFLPIRVLTPPMADSAFAETHNVNTPQGHCDTFGDGSWSGYGEMTSVFSSYFPKNDGYSWHNYFIKGREAWADCPDGQHVSMWFPEAMSNNIGYGLRPAVMTEIDLASPWQGRNDPVTDKDAQANEAAASIRDFIYKEKLASRVAVWLLHDNTPPDDPRAAEQQWHQAYTPTIGLRPWFTQWWYSSEIP